ncbi:hypothetical protein ACFWIX_08205 [Pseudarthrobacter sp. NPDC058362]|uniref:hypothetical protein n=1 Tax=Pseudarthrobacter sp. NPDC058362 TaxID=3346458 RepID=UPI003649E152
MTLDQVLLIFVPILAGGFALAGSWFGSWLGRKNEHGQWLRNQRQAAYSEFLGTFDVLYLETGRPEVVDATVQKVLFDLVVKQGRMTVVGPSEVRVLGDRLVDDAWGMVQAARGVGPDAGQRYLLRDKAKVAAQELIEALRNDLNVVKR